MNLQRLKQPAFIIDRSRVTANLERMSATAKANGVTLRVHAKTPQSATVAGWMRQFGVNCLTVSSVAMAEYFVAAGWNDISIAIPVNLHQIPEINKLAAKCALHVVVDSELTADKLAQSIVAPLNVWIETDTGHQRTGVPVADTGLLVRIAAILVGNPKLTLRGLLCHDGHTYAVSGREAVQAIFDNTFRSLTAALSALDLKGFNNLSLSVGDTPTCSLVNKFPAPIKEIRPGNFVFFDLMQTGIGACRNQDFAAAVACPVISVQPERNELVVYGGGVHISADPLRRKDGGLYYGEICRLNNDVSGWGEPLSGVSLVNLTQEHGIIRGPRTFIESVAIGDTMVVLPVHVCMTANLHSRYYVLGEGEIEKFRL